LDIVENEDEIAAVVACEIAHVLARHTYPVEFTLCSDIFFDVAETLDELRLKAKPSLPDNSKTGQHSPGPTTPQIKSTSKSIHPSEGS